MTSWGSFTAAEPALAAFVTERLRARPSFLATVRASGDVDLPEHRRRRADRGMERR